MQCTREAAVQRAVLGTRRITRGGPQAVGGASFLDLKEALEQLLRRPVDLIELYAISNRRVRHHIEQSKSAVAVRWPRWPPEHNPDHAHAGSRLPMKIADADTESAVRKFMAWIPADLPAERVLLYGSRARGDFRPDSDADVAVILRHGADDWKLLWTLTGLAYDIFFDTGIMIQPVPVSSRDWADPDSFPRPSFLRNVAQEGIQL